MEAKRKKSWRLIKPKVITLVLYGQEREVTLERAFNCGSQQRGGKAIMKNEISLADFSSFETRSQGEKFIFRFSASKLYTKAKFVINIWQWQREKKEWKKCCLGVEWANHFSLRSFIWRSLRNIIRIEPTEFYRSGLGAKCMLFFPPSPSLSSHPETENNFPLLKLIMWHSLISVLPFEVNMMEDSLSRCSRVEAEQHVPLGEPF